MKITELEQKLKEIREAHGDLPVYAHPIYEEMEVFKSGTKNDEYAYIKAIRTGNEGK